MRLRFILGEVGSGIRRNLSMIISVVLVTMVSMFFLGLGLLAQKQVTMAKGYWYDKVEVSIFLCTNDSSAVASCVDGVATKAQTDQVRRDLESMRPLVDAIYYESSGQAYNRFKQQFKNSPYLSEVTADSMPASKTPNRVQADAASSATPEATARGRERPLSNAPTPPATASRSLQRSRVPALLWWSGSAATGSIRRSVSRIAARSPTTPSAASVRAGPA